jgi:preprotein translocase subunit SecG
MFHVILGLHIVLCILLVILTLLQQGKGADAGAALGGSSNSLFGASGATSMIVKVTTGIAVAFFFTSIALIRLYNDKARESVGVTTAKSSSLLEQIAEEGKKDTAAVPPTAEAKTIPAEKTAADTTKK